MVGASPAQYQEVEGREQSLGARGRWAMPTDALVDDHFVWPEDDAQEVAFSARDGEASAVAAPAVADAALRSSMEIRSIAPKAAAVPQSPVVPSFTEPVVDMPAPPPLSSVFARLLKQDAPHGDAL